MAENDPIPELDAIETGPIYRSACTECQRRKQKCERRWPCDHCLKRKVGDVCDYSSEMEPTQAWTASAEVKRKRDQQCGEEDDTSAAAATLEAMGYTTTHLLANLNIGADRTRSVQFRINPADSPQLRRALAVLPERRFIDTLIRNFLDNVNFYYYIVYPNHFLTQYAEWWVDREKNRPLGLQWTCLLVMACACSVQHFDGAPGRKLEQDLGSSKKELSEKYHNAARELFTTIPVGHSHFLGVQYLLHSCYWFKAEARFVECWQILGATVREAQALNLHLESKDRMPNFEREMRRRLWCIVDSWDWLVSSLLARPMLIDRTDCNVALPYLSVEPFPVSPMLHLKLQSQLVAIIFKRFGPPKVLTDIDDILEYQRILDKFMEKFPAAYAFEDPDTSSEDKHPWIALHRHYMQTCTLAIALGPFRPYMAKKLDADSPEIELQFRRDGINYSKKLLTAVMGFYRYVWNRDTTFHFVPFCIFDTAALLCSALLHDTDNSIPDREEIVDNLYLSLDTLANLRTATETAKAPFNVLQRLIHRVMEDMGTTFLEGQNKRHKKDDGTPKPSPAETEQSSQDEQSSGTATEQTPSTPQPAEQPSTDASYCSVPGTLFSQEPPTAVVKGVVQAIQPNLAPTGQYGQWNNGYQQCAPNNMLMGSMHMNTAPIITSQPMNGVMVAHPTNEAPAWTTDDTSRANLEMQHRVMMETQNMGSGMFSEGELGDLVDLWNWESLDLGFNTNPIMQNGN